MSAWHEPPGAFYRALHGVLVLASTQLPCAAIWLALVRHRSKQGQRWLRTTPRKAKHPSPNVETGDHRSVQEPGGADDHAVQPDQLVELCRLDHELADVDRAEPAGDALEHDVQPVAAGKQGVDERLADVDAPTTRLEHPLDQLVDLPTRQDDRSELVPAVTGDEDPGRIVDPERSLGLRQSMTINEC